MTDKPAQSAASNPKPPKEARPKRRDALKRLRGGLAAVAAGSLMSAGLALPVLADDGGAESSGSVTEIVGLAAAAPAEATLAGTEDPSAGTGEPAEAEVAEAPEPIEPAPAPGQEPTPAAEDAAPAVQPAAPLAAIAGSDDDAGHEDEETETEDEAEHEEGEDEEEAEHEEGDHEDEASPIVATKKANSVEALGDESEGRWYISYTIQVTNQPNGDGDYKDEEEYTLSDTLSFGHGIEVERATWSKGDKENQFQGNTAELASKDDDVELGEGKSHFYHVYATVKVADGTPEYELTCKDGYSGGLLNKIYVDGNYADSACADIPHAPKYRASFEVDKKWVIDGEEFDHGSQPDGFDAWLKLGPDSEEVADAAWDTQYTDFYKGDYVYLKEEAKVPEGCLVDYREGLGERELMDKDSAFTVVNHVECEQNLTLAKDIDPEDYWDYAEKWTLTATAEGEDEPTLEGTSWVSGSVDPDVTYTLAEEADFDGEDEFSAGDWVCELVYGEGKVYQDGDKLTPSYGQDIRCVIENSLDAEGLEVDKTAGEAIDVGAGIWEIEYEVSVTNNSKIAWRDYLLTDTLKFGDGIRVTNAEWIRDNDGEEGVWEDPEEDATTTLADGRGIEPDSTDLYIVWARVVVDSDASEDQLDCRLEEDEGTGLLNKVLLNGKYSAEACAEVEAPDEETPAKPNPETEEPPVSPEEPPVAQEEPPAPGAAAPNPEPAPVVYPQAGGLAMTGTESIGLVSAALLLMTAGTAATVFSRRRRKG
ncbi:hypothetical protein [Crystallibacter degradans]|uniref:hypothetical protein n=1 Tax=Crystallibacter degradans TaxID=2726743 RepID=UPI001475726F|nr:hypothetical protein [Arthrobacter sp. SF27]NMR28203.1 hypothetical protein [Arthrobacter sp. SF27]